MSRSAFGFASRSLRSAARRTTAGALLGLTALLAPPQVAAAQPVTTTGPGAPSLTAPAELFGRDEMGFDAPYQALAQTFQPFVGGGTIGFLQSFTVYMQAANFDTPTSIPSFSAGIWTIGAGPALELTALLRPSSGPTGSTLLEGWKAVTFDFSNLQLTKNVTYAFVLGVTGYAGLPDGAINYVAMNDGSATGAAFGASEGSTTVSSATSFTRLSAFDPQQSRTLAYSASFTTTAVVPEPATFVLFAGGLVVLLLFTSRRRRSA